VQAGARSGTANSLNRSHISVIRFGRNVFSQSRKLPKPIQLPFDCSSVIVRWVSVPDFSVAAGDIAESRPGELRHYAELVAQLSLAASEFARYLGQTAALDAATCTTSAWTPGNLGGLSS
jgi:hypothetical protein